MDMNFTTMAGLTAAFAVVAGIWNQVKTIARYLVGFVIGKSILKDDVGEAVMAYSFSNAIRSPLGQRIFGGYESYVHPKRWIESVAYEGTSSDPILIRYGRQFALISLVGSRANICNSDIGNYENGYNLISIRYFRWTFNIEQFIIDALDFYNRQKRQKVEETKNVKKKKTLSRFKIIRYTGHGTENQQGDIKQSSPSYPTSPVDKPCSTAENMIMTGVYRLLKWNREDLQMKPEDGKSPFTGYPFPEEVAGAIKELQCWMANEKWFRSKSIPWRRGWLLHGIPGTGKSTLTRALGMSFDLPVNIFDLSGMTNNELIRSWDAMMSNTPCIALIEDIDAIFNGREYVGATNVNISHLTFDCLLNCISGVKQADGVFLIVTTNHLDKLDSALGIPDTTGKSSRPGRIDKAIHLGLMAEPQRKLLAQHILSDYPELINETVAAGEGETAAQFQSRCAQLALSKFWNDGKFLNKEIEHINKEQQTNEVWETGEVNRNISKYHVIE